MKTNIISYQYTLHRQIVAVHTKNVKKRRPYLRWSRLYCTLENTKVFYFTHNTSKITHLRVKRTHRAHSLTPWELPLHHCTIHTTEGGGGGVGRTFYFKDNKLNTISIFYCILLYKRTAWKQNSSLWFVFIQISSEKQKSLVLIYIQKRKSHRNWKPASLIRTLLSLSREICLFVALIVPVDFFSRI